MNQLATPPRFPRINEPAPDFQAKSTHGVVRLSDYTNKGKWVLLFSHPADFTPVCTTEFVEFGRNHSEFEKRNVQLIGVSIDSVYSHIAWARNIEQNFNVKIEFPVVADLDQKVAASYGMVHEAVSDTSAVRAVFVIDPKGIIRAVLYYPLSLGRNIAEIIRVFDALQTSDANACSTPANWVPGKPVMAPPPLSKKDADARVLNNGDLQVTDWYFAQRDLATTTAK